MVTMGQHLRNGTGLLIQNYKIGNEKVSFAAGNWNSTSAGHLNVDSSYWGKWRVE
jgi:hypothetical protein